MEREVLTAGVYIFSEFEIEKVRCPFLCVTLRLQVIPETCAGREALAADCAALNSKSARWRPRCSDRRRACYSAWGVRSSRPRA